MPEAPTDTRSTIHWVGTGLSTGSGLRALADRDEHLVVWGRTADKAAACARGVGAQITAARAFDLAELSEQLVAGDIVISMLPATEHAALLRACLAKNVHFACSSYTSDELAELAEAARAAGLVVLTEAGLDPGIDHLFAHVLLGEAVDELGHGPATVSLTSYCGGVPAVANEFHYLFSWAPQGVLTALLTPARHVEFGEVTEVARPWQAVRSHRVAQEEFEVYPNRDSVPFIAQYDVPTEWRVETFVRGTLRLPGWHEAWRDVFAALERDGLDCVPALATDLAERYPMTASDRDRVVLVVELDVETADGRSFFAGRVLDLVGDEYETAMARCVSMPLAIGVGRVLDGQLPAGLNRAGETAAEARLWLEALAIHPTSGIITAETVTAAVGTA